MTGSGRGEHVRALQEVYRKLPALRQELTSAQESLVVIARNLAPKEFKAALMTLAHRADPAAVAADEALDERETFCVDRGVR
jgi:hypothetical protein